MLFHSFRLDLLYVLHDSWPVSCVLCLQVGGEEFLQVLRSFDLRLKREHLGLFLARCGMELRKNGIDYPQFLRRFQDRSEDGLTHSILSNPKHRLGVLWSATQTATEREHNTELSSKCRVYFLKVENGRAPKDNQMAQSRYMPPAEPFDHLFKLG